MFRGTPTKETCPVPAGLLPCLSQKELPSMQVRASSCARLGEPASGSEQGDMNLSRNERPVGSAEGTWQTRLSPPSPPLSGSPSCFLLFQSTLKPSQHTCLLSAWHALSSQPLSVPVCMTFLIPVYPTVHPHRFSQALVSSQGLFSKLEANCGLSLGYPKRSRVPAWGDGGHLKNRA